VVTSAWNTPLQVANPFLRLHIKLKRTGIALRKWAKGLVGSNRVMIIAVTQLIGILDVVQDYRQLTHEELKLKKDLKLRLLGLTAVEKLRARQASRITHIRAAKENSKLFYLQANGRRRKNYIHSIESATGTASTQEDKEKLIFEHFGTQFGPPSPRETTLNWDEIGLQRHDLIHLDEDFTVEEVYGIIKDIAAEKAYVTTHPGKYRTTA
jgi:hypothetical protein